MVFASFQNLPIGYRDARINYATVTRYRQVRLCRIFRWQWCWWQRYVGDFMLMTDLRCWWQNHYVDDFFFVMLGIFSMYLICHQHRCHLIFIMAMMKRILHRFDLVNWASREVALTVDHLFDIFFLTFSCVWFSVSIKLAPLCIGLVIFSLTFVGFSRSIHPMCDHGISIAVINVLCLVNLS